MSDVIAKNELKNFDGYEFDSYEDRADDCLPPVTWPPCATNADTSGQVEVGSYADT